MGEPRPALLAPSNPIVADMRRLGQRRRVRRERGRYLIEGVRLVHEALDVGVEIDTIVVRDDADVAELEAAARAMAIPLHRLAARVFDGVSTTSTPQPALAIATTADASVEAVIADVSLVLVLVDVSDPGNAGTILRAADAVGDAGVVFVGNSVDAYNPKTVRAAAGALFRVPHAIEVGVDEVFAALDSARFDTFAATLDGDDDYDGLDLARRASVVLGSESHGLDPGVVGRCGHAVRIPMAGSAESLNVAMAATVVAFEAARQRRRRP